ncbi:phosphatidylglycerophosphatase and protein-tyrosine phosphatase 1-like [Daphnia carinata]|uniref:phosphatidylglycerophosphatase and protein-tyrosine phosphatase 1-like n=1 Tax=Daphnia carinata TaxID=120202 RepID=UPI00257A82F4|nr:phosphatidylglycerophosphatase and protein-tyrosine phosphatase 1-like [Daphnia carinata]
MESPDKMSSVLARVLFFPSLAYNVMMEKISSRQWYNHVDNHVILGALPLRNKTQELIETEKVNTVVSLNEDYEVKYLTHQPEEWKKLGVDAIRFSVVDMFEAPPQDMLLKGVEFINKKISDGGVVYVHCKAGRSRSAALVACYLMKKHNWTPEQVILHLKSVRPHILLPPNKVNALEIFYKSHVQCT